MIKNKIVLVPFPFDNLTTTKLRPAVCLTDKIGPHNHVVVAFITSQVPVDLMETDIVVDSDNKDFQKNWLKGVINNSITSFNDNFQINYQKRIGTIVKRSSIAN